MSPYSKSHWMLPANLGLNKGSISRNLTLSLVSIVIVVVLGTGFYHYSRESKKLRDEIETRADKSISELTEILSVLVWGFDLNSIQRVGSVFVQDELIHEVNVVDEQGEVLFHYEKPPDNSQKIKRGQAITYEKEIIGKANIVLTLSQYEQELSRLMQTTVWNLLGSIAVIIVATGILLRVYLRKPLMILHDGMHRIAEGDYTYSFSEVRQRELVEIANRFREMSSRIEAREHSLRDINRMLEKEISEREKAENALRKSEAKFRELVEGTDDLVTQVDGEGRFTYANHKAKDIFGLSPEELIGKSAFSFIHPDDMDFTRENFDNWVNHKVQGVMFENRQVNQTTGEVHELLWTINLHYDAQGRVEFLNSIASDITARKKAEQEQAILQERLRQSQKMEALGNLSGGIAHDFNNLLQALSGYIQLLLLKKSDQESDYKYLKEMDKAATRASELVRRLLTFSRKMEVKLSHVNLNEVVQNTIKLLERTIPKMVAIETHFDPALPVIQADPTQMEQVIMNLANNAVDAMEGSGTMTIETEVFTVNSATRNACLELTSGEYILIKVTDTGRGMNEETKQRIFEPFFTTKEPGKGTGLGLATVYGIIKGHKGHIHCYSELNLGTTFKIYLPVENVVEECDKDMKCSAPEEISGGTETILLVDDEKLILEIAEEVLTPQGYTVLKAESGEEAKDIFAAGKEHIDLIILDLGMPGMGGEKCLEEIKKINPDVKVIVASGYAAHKIAKNPGRFGASAFISKPYRLDEFLIKVRKILDTQ